MSGFHRLHTLRMENDAAGFAMAEMRPRFERMADRHENGTAPRAVVVHQLFQTPAAVAVRLVSLLALCPGARVLEPSAGLGRLLDALKPCQCAEVVAVELAPDCARELFAQEREGVTIKQRDFLTIAPAETGLFDAVVMNPPFTMRADLRHIRHALQFVKPGGKLAAICMDTTHRREALQHLGQWIDLEPGAFKESGTNISTAMVLIQR